MRRKLPPGASTVGKARIWRGRRPDFRRRSVVGRPNEKLPRSTVDHRSHVDRGIPARRERRKILEGAGSSLDLEKIRREGRALSPAGCARRLRGRKVESLRDLRGGGGARLLALAAGLAAAGVAA